MRSSGLASTSYAPAPAHDAAALRGRRATALAACRPASVTLGSMMGAYRRQRAQDVIASKVAQLAQQIMNAHAGVKILALCATALPVVWAGGFAYSFITGAPITLGLFKIYSVVIRAPGAKVTEETSLPAAALMNVMFLAGLFSFAVLIGIVSEEIKNSLKNVRIGNYPVVCANHTVLLNYNNQTPLLLRKIAADGHGCLRTLGRDIVILADEPKEKIEAEVLRAVDGSGLSVTIREGTPFHVRDLDSVSAASARTVIILHRESDAEAEVHNVATLLGLQTARSHPSTAYPPQRVVLQTPEVAPEVAAAVMAGSSEASVAPLRVLKERLRGQDVRVVEIHGNRNIARLIAQSAVQPSVASIYSAIVQSVPGAPDLYVREVGQVLAGRTFGDARRAFDSAVVCGYVDAATRRTRLNPPDACRLSYADRLIGLAHRREDFAVGSCREGEADLLAPDMQALAKLLERASPITHTPKSIVVVNWEGDVADLVSAVQDFGYAGSEITVISEERPHNLPATGAVAVHWVQGGVLDRAAYERAGVASADSVVIGSVNAADPKAADARMLTSLLIITRLVADAPHAPHVVATMQTPETVHTAHHILSELGKGKITAELLQPDEMVAGMVLQVANEPGLAATLSELTLDAVGSEIYLRRPEPYGLDGSRPFTFREVSELARLRGETALGWMSRGAGNDSEVVLCPVASQELPYSRNNCRIIVLAEGYDPVAPTPLLARAATGAQR